MKGGIAWVFVSSGISMSPAQRTTYQVPSTWEREASLSRATGGGEPGKGTQAGAEGGADAASGLDSESRCRWDEG